ncbi:hypothetical protein R3P38DRAFT_2811848 [Favolaschia claudopus]
MMKARAWEFLVSELKRTALKMREPPADITLRQRFMRLLPADVHNELIRRPGNDEERRQSSRVESPPQGDHREIHDEEYWKEFCEKQNKAGPNSASAAPRPNKTCFGCGLVGHIASDPSPVIPTMKMRDEEVLSDGDDSDAGHWRRWVMGRRSVRRRRPTRRLSPPIMKPQVPHQDDRELEAHEADPHDAPDLADLIDNATPTEVRVGAMQYFAMRIDNEDLATRDDNSWG